MAKIASIKNMMSHDELVSALEEIPDEVLQRISFSMPWQYSSVTTDGREKDEDNFPITRTPSEEDPPNRDALQRECFSKFHANPHVNTSVRGLVGRLTGLGFSVSCGDVYEIQEVIDEIELDVRNRLYYYWPKWVGRYHIEGELFLCFTVHPNGFIEVDFYDPGSIAFGGDQNTGIIFHPKKSTMPLFYNIRKPGVTYAKPAGGSHEDLLEDQIPSIFIAHYPDLVDSVRKHDDFSVKLQAKNKKKGKNYGKMGGYFRFMVGIDRGFMTRRAVSYLRTVIEWLNHYENLKKYEIDHKKSSGAYVWAFKFDDVKAFRVWLSLSDEDKKKTAAGGKLTPGSRLILPPGMDVVAVNPSLTQIKDQDTDILQMVASGLNEPEDILTGTSRNSFSSVKASRGPFSDRISDEIAYFDRFLRYDFWGSIFFLRSQMIDFPLKFKVEEAIGFKNKKPEYKKVPKLAMQLIETSYPSSDAIDFEGRAKGLLGVKHGPIAEQLGVSNKWVADRIGVGGYSKQRLAKATEDKKFPELVYEGGVDAESMQEKAEGEKRKVKNEEKQKKMMDDFKASLSEFPSHLISSIRAILKEVEDKFLDSTDRSNKFMADVFNSLNELKDKPINIIVEPPVINIPKTEPSPVTVVNEQVNKERKFKIVRDKDGLICRFEGERVYNVNRSKDGTIEGFEEGEDNG